MILTINKPTRVTRKTTAVIDHILTNSFTDTVFKTAIFKSGISDHFPICFMIPSSMKQAKIQKITSNLKEYLAQNQLSCLNINCMKPFRMTLKPLKTPRKRIKVFLIFFLIYMTLIS